MFWIDIVVTKGFLLIFSIVYGVFCLLGGCSKSPIPPPSIQEDIQVVPSASYSRKGDIILTKDTQETINKMHERDAAYTHAENMRRMELAEMSAYYAYQAEMTMIQNTYHSSLFHAICIGIIVGLSSYLGFLKYKEKCTIERDKLYAKNDSLSWLEIERETLKEYRDQANGIK